MHQHKKVNTERGKNDDHQLIVRKDQQAILFFSVIAKLAFVCVLLEANGVEFPTFNLNKTLASACYTFGIKN